MTDAMTGAIRMLQLYTGLDDDGLASVYSVRDRSVPWLRVNMVSTADGAATRDGLSGGLGTAADRRVFSVLRRLCDVIVVAAGTVRAEGYSGPLVDEAGRAWRRAEGLSEHPRFAVVSRSLDLDPAVLAASPERPLVLTCEDAPADRREALAAVADVIDCGGASVDTRLIKERLADRGMPQQHCEGGPSLLGALAADGTLDELCLTVSPTLEGGAASRIAVGAGAASVPLRLAHVLAADDGTLLLRYTRA
ncbi:pyrimidine reductase family protein [Salinibacterium sp. SYSU T00001]|uniref:pyrimidine reductase family protein n=1 Tax=Homoserinimonas sedimenticola TaxID=2986805 RepID=UPI0022364DDF|nr:pyrimidine reductase family protein [Salinibacterium sedimenticola]MCW4386154.1 pyrimidine reductase family protein [Salinibacterium sedimenticola]